MVADFKFAIEDAVRITSISDTAWNDTGTHVGFLRSDDGETNFGAVSVGPIETTAVDLGNGQYEPDVGTSSGDISEFTWRPNSANEVAVITDGTIGLFDIETSETETVTAARAEHASLAWHPDGSQLAYLRDGTAWVQDLDSGGAWTLDRDEDAPRVADIFAFGTELLWDPSGRYLATVVEAQDETLGVAVYDGETGERVWTTLPELGSDRLHTSPVWVGEGHLVYTDDSFDGSHRVYRSVEIGTDDGRGTALISEDVEGILLPHKPVGSEHGQLAILSARTGYRHVYAINVLARRSAVGNDPNPGFEGPGVTQVTSGEYEARGHASDVPAWSTDGTRLAYVTNERDRGERQLYVATIDADGTVTDITGFKDIDGVAIEPTFSPDGRIAFLRSGRTSPTDVHVADLESKAMRRITACHDEPELFAAFPEPEPVVFESADGTEIYGYLYTPPEAEPGDDRPAVIQCHGGPISQMPRGFRPGSGIGHAIDRTLTNDGFIVLELNFRSGIGRGRDFEQAIHHSVGVPEVEDCEAAATFLRDHDLVGNQIGVWGISYGGFMANIMATKSDAIDAAVNVAGIWNWRTWEEWAIDQSRTHWGTGEETWFHMRFGGPPHSDDPAVQERYDRASPSEFVSNMNAPVLALHGVDDKNVPVTETFGLAGDAAAHGKPFEMACYPDEEHGFEQHAIWADAYGRMYRFFVEHLRNEA